MNTYTNDDINNAQLRMIQAALDYANVNNASTESNAGTVSSTTTNTLVSKKPLIDKILILYGMTANSPDVYVEYTSNGVVYNMSTLYELDNRINVSQERQSLVLSLLRSYVMQIGSASDTTTDNMTALVYNIETVNLTVETVPGKPDGLWFDDYAHTVLNKMI